MANSGPKRRSLRVLDVPLEPNVFFRNLLRELSGTLQHVVGLDEAAGFISVVGQNIGRQINADYKKALGVETLSREQIADVLVDLKARIEGDFYVIEENTEKLVLGNRRCPFADKVVGRPSLCMMTSNVFGSITADNAGYAKVILDETIAGGADGCRVSIYLNPDGEAENKTGREYYGGDDSDIR